MTKKKVDIRKKGLHFDPRLLIILVLAIAGIGVYVHHMASASYMPYQICNSKYSANTILLWSEDWIDGPVTKKDIPVPKGQCKTVSFSIASGRVDVEPPYGSRIHSYSINGSCHDHSNNFQSNPPNSGTPVYRTFTNSTCKK